ncbi:hypothetical protein RN001_007593 [Aquatica leii]|uniref:Major facilitator superfamily (MFS) profile domain-containing protein n=1 Tax=Aquatica leii TaxID=1421715 RepID=A0AAN7P8J0_9COLE|nr:hypothetical protein RN001_007593 [Aquatica leii]
MVTEENKTCKKQDEPRLYKKRWFILFLYVIVAPTSTMQWTQYTIVADVIRDYYKVSYEAVNWTNLTALLCYVIFAFPSCYAIDKYGIRKTLIITTCATCVATWIKVGSVSPDNFWVIIVGQIVLSIPQACLLNLPPKLAANWFGPDEVSMACSVGLTGIQLGAAFGFLLPPVLIKKETVDNDLFVTGLGLAVICTITLFLIVPFFSNKPSVPPSYAAMKQDLTVNYIHSIKQILKNIPLILAVLGAGINVAVFCVFQALLNQIILYNYPDGSEDAGLIGVLMVVMGLFGSVIAGIILDKFKIYRAFILILDTSIVLTFIVFSFTLKMNIIFPYVLFLILAKWSVSYQIAIETSYPEPEAAVVGLINGVGQSLGIAFTYAYSYIFYQFNDFWANIFLSSTCFVSLFFIAFSKFELKRQLTNTTLKDEVPKEITKC